jgi:hypothetical protein
MRPTAYRRNARGLRDRQAFEAVRMQAGALFAAGHTQAQVARTLGVARQNVSRLTGVAYHPGHTWKLLRRMGWRLQRPARRAVERDEQAIARWVAEDWP